MTTEEFKNIFTDIRDNIFDVIEANTTIQPKIYKREVVDLASEKEWVGRLKNSNGKISCWTVAYSGTQERTGNAIATKTFSPAFRIIGYYGFDFGTNNENSADIFQNEIATLRYAFLENPTLNHSWVESHSGFSDKTILSKIDTQLVHIAKINLTVNLIEIPYTYSA